MKKAMTVSILLLSALSIFGFQAIYQARNNQLENVRTVSETTGNNAEMKTKNVEILATAAQTTPNQDYEYYIGERLALSLLQNCSIFSGTIQNMKDAEQGKQVDLQIDEWLSGERNNQNNNIQLVFSTFVSLKSTDDNALMNVSFKLRGKLIVASCGETNIYRLVVSEEKYFASIKEVIKYQSSKTSEDSFMDVPNVPAAQDNFVMAGYILNRMWRLGTIGDVNGRATVLTELLGKNTIPKDKWADIRAQLNFILTSNNDNLLPSTSETIAQKLVQMGSSSDTARAEQAILALVELSKNEKISFKQFVTRENSAKLNQNYKSLVEMKIPAEDKKNFEKQLL